MAGYAKEIDLVDKSDEEIQRVLLKKDAQNTKNSTKFAIQAFRPFGDLQTFEAWKILIKDWQRSATENIFTS